VQIGCLFTLENYLKSTMNYNKYKVCLLVCITWTSSGHFSNSVGSFVTTLIVPIGVRGTNSQNKHTILLTLEINEGGYFYKVILNS